MKIIAAVKTWRGECFAIPSLESIYDHVDKIVYLHSAISWSGEPGNTVAPEIAKWKAENDKANKIDINTLDTQDQTLQYTTIFDHINKNYEHDYKMLVDTDEVHDDENLTRAMGYLENGMKRNDAMAFACRMITHIKSPFYQIEPLDACCPTLFVRNTAAYAPVRCSGVSPKIMMNDVLFHHFSGVRRNLHLVWEKHAVSSMVENEPILDKKEWVEKSWNILPFARGFHPNTNYRHTWQSIRVVGVEDLPKAARNSPIVQAFARYPMNKGIDAVGPAELVKHGLPADFGPGHPDWNTPSKRAKYQRVVEELTRRRKSAPQKKTLPEPPTPAKSSSDSNTPAVIVPARIHTADEPGSVDLSTLPPSKRNKYFANLGTPPGDCCVFTMVSGKYQWYIPLFHYFLSKAYPEYDIRIYVRGEIEIPPSLFYRDIIPMNPKSVVQDYPIDGYTTAAMRFVHEDDALRSYDYVHFQDIDMLILREDPPIVDQHWRSMMANGLQCYDNYVSSHVIHEGAECPRLPGVHFVTRDWWDITREARQKYAAQLAVEGSPAWYWDEVMLAKIVIESGLPVQDKRLNLWAHHGIHLGDYRRRQGTKEVIGHVEASHTVLMSEILRDQRALELFRMCGEHIPSLMPTLEVFRGIVG